METPAATERERERKEEGGETRTGGGGGGNTALCRVASTPAGRRCRRRANAGPLRFVVPDDAGGVYVGGTTTGELRPTRPIRQDEEEGLGGGGTAWGVEDAEHCAESSGRASLVVLERGWFPCENVEKESLRKCLF